MTQNVYMSHDVSTGDNFLVHTVISHCSTRVWLVSSWEVHPRQNQVQCLVKFNEVAMSDNHASTAHSLLQGLN